MIVDIQKIAISEASSIRDAMAAINQGAMQLAVVVDADRRLLATAIDSDIRGGLLRRLTLESPVSAVMRRNRLPIRQPQGVPPPAA